MTEETITETVEETTETPASDDSLVGSVEEKAPEGLTDVPDHPVETKDEYDYPEGFFSEEGKADKEAIKEYLGNQKKADEKFNKRILDLRRTISNGKAPETSDKYFEDYAPEERFMKLFDPNNEDMTEEDRTVITEISDHLAKTYLDSGLNKVQGAQVSNAVLQVLESLGAVDSKTKDEKTIEKSRWIESQKKELGSNADNIIREAKQFVETSPSLSAKTKNDLVNLMESQGAPFIDTIMQLKDSFGGAASGVPVSVADLGGLAPDYELKAEYLDPATTDIRKQTITSLRAKAGRNSRLMDSQA